MRIVFEPLLWKIRDLVVLYKKFLISDETIDAAKQKWDDLAREDAKYFIFSTKHNQSDSEFRDSGKIDYDKQVKNDALLQELITARKPKTILEIGCGIGRVTEFFLNDFQEVIGTDISAEMIRLAKQRLSHFQNAQFYETDGLHLPQSNNSVDFVFSFIVFQHMPTLDVIKQNLKEVWRVLKPGGIAKIQLRGTPADKAQWYYGPNVNESDGHRLFENIGFNIICLSGINQKYSWFLVEKPFENE